MNFFLLNLVIFAVFVKATLAETCKTMQCDEANGRKRFSTDLGMKDCEGSCEPLIVGKYPCCQMCCFDSLLKHVNGSWSEWGSWTSCSTTCDDGVRSRGRSCTNPYPAGNGTACLNQDLQRTFVEVQSEKCLLKKCFFRTDFIAIIILGCVLSISIIFIIVLMYLMHILIQKSRKGKFGGNTSIISSDVQNGISNILSTEEENINVPLNLVSNLSDSKVTPA